MHLSDLPKPIKKAFRAIIASAHEAELRRALEGVRESFEEWEAGNIDSFELADRIHTFHSEANREIFLRYTGRLDPRFLLERALGEGLMRRNQFRRSSRHI